MLNFPVLRFWNWIFAAIWLASIPALNEWGAYPIPEFASHFSGYESPFAPAWYARWYWQGAIAIGFVLLKYPAEWAWDWFWNRR